MMSNDKFVTVEILDERINELKKELKIEINTGNTQIRNELKDATAEINTAIKINAVDNAHLQTSIYWGFAIATLTIGVVIAIVGFFVTLAPSLRENSKRKESKYTTVEQVQSIVENAISKALLNIGK